MARLLGHRQTKEAATDKPNLRLPRHISTLPPVEHRDARSFRFQPDPDTRYLGPKGTRTSSPKRWFRRRTRFWRAFLIRQFLAY